MKPVPTLVRQVTFLSIKSDWFVSLIWNVISYLLSNGWSETNIEPLWRSMQKRSFKSPWWTWDLIQEMLYLYGYSIWLVLVGDRNFNFCLFLKCKLFFNTILFCVIADFIFLWMGVKCWHQWLTNITIVIFFQRHHLKLIYMEKKWLNQYG